MYSMRRLLEELAHNGVLVDGPFTETKEVAVGFAILKAASAPEAIERTKRFLRILGDEWDIDCEVHQLDEPVLQRRGGSTHDCLRISQSLKASCASQ
jgi:YCII-related domain